MLWRCGSASTASWSLLVLASVWFLCLPSLGAAAFKASIWQPVPYRETRAPSQTATAEKLEKLKKRDLELERIEQELQKKEDAILSREIAISQQTQHLQEWWTDQERRLRILRCERAQFREGWAEQETSLLHLIVFSLVRIQASAAVDVEVAAPGAVVVSSTEDGERNLVRSAHAGTAPRASYPHWGRVEIVACIRGSLKAVAGEIPVYSILRASTPVDVTDICREKDDGMANTTQLLVKLLDYLTSERKQQQERNAIPTLYYVVAHSVNVFFNELREAQTSDGYPSEPLSAAEFIRRYEATVASEMLEDAAESQLWPPPAVAAVERVCRRSRGRPCSPDEAERPPYLHAGGLAGPAEALERVVGAMIVLSEDVPEADQLDATSLLRRVAEEWSGILVPDRQQLLFGSLVEVAAGPCDGGRAASVMPSSRQQQSPGAWCPSQEPCCPLNNDFFRLDEAYHNHYRAQGCTLWRVDREDVPILWHGDGLAKWTYALAMHSLAATCPYVARLVLKCHPSDLLEDLFDRFEATQAPGAVARRPADSAHQRGS